MVFPLILGRYDQADERCPRPLKSRYYVSVLAESRIRYRRLQSLVLTGIEPIARKDETPRKTQYDTAPWFLRRLAWARKQPESLTLKLAGN